MLILVDSSSEVKLEYYQYQILQKIKVGYDLFNYLQGYRDVMQFQISLDGRASIEIPASSKLDFSKKISVNHDHYRP